MEQAFQPAFTNETIINLWAGKNAVGNEILREWVGWEVSFGAGCDINGQKVSEGDITTQKMKQNMREVQHLFVKIFYDEHIVVLLSKVHWVQKHL